MKESYWGYWIVLLGVFIVVIMLLVQNVTTNNTEDYYTLKQLNEAAMIDAVDYAYYMDYGEIKINKEKFIESFLRRFAEAATITDKYEIVFTGIYEAPPKVSIQITSKTNTYNIASDPTSFDMTNRIDAILENNTTKSIPSNSSSITVK